MENQNGHGGDDFREDVANHLKGFLNGGFGLIQGLGMTLKHLFEPPVTIQYPTERWQPAHGYRGMPVLTTDEETGELKCVGCQACARACPPCMLCNLCVEACPFEAITMSDHYEMADYELEGIVVDKEELVNIYHNSDSAMVLAGHSWKPDEPEDKE